MLIIRFQRTGRRNSPFYRVVLQNKKDAIGSKALEILGSYNPHTKDAVLKKDEILKFINNGAQVSNSIAKLFIAQSIKHARIVFVASAIKAPKKKAKEVADKKAEASQQDTTVERVDVAGPEPIEEAATQEEADQPKADKPRAQAPEEKTATSGTVAPVGESADETVEENAKEEKPAEEKVPKESKKGKNKED